MSQIQRINILYELENCEVELYHVLQSELVKYKFFQSQFRSTNTS